jgi:hypothetical protein
VTPRISFYALRQRIERRAEPDGQERLSEAQAEVQEAEEPTGTVANSRFADVQVYRSCTGETVSLVQRDEGHAAGFYGNDLVSVVTGGVVDRRRH